MQSFEALVIEGDSKKNAPNLKKVDSSFIEKDGECLIRVSHSSLGYKDALALTNRGRILRHFPLIAGQDAVGVVEEGPLPKGQEVVITGFGLGEERNGGFAQCIRVPPPYAVPLPSGLSAKEAIALGTAGFTAVQAILEMQTAGLNAEQGPVLVTGASGGVGSIACECLSQLGFEVVALTSRTESHAHLKSLGASKVISWDELPSPRGPLSKPHYAGVADNLGGEMISRILPQVKPFGCVAAIGLALGHTFDATVFPFILRGVKLLGINSTYCPDGLRNRVWQALSQELKPRKLSSYTNEIDGLENLKEKAELLLDRKLKGRWIVRLP